MSKTYYIRGTITIRVDCVKGDESRVGITPCAGFLTPDKPQKAIAFPISATKGAADVPLDSNPENGSEYEHVARLIGLNEKTCEFDAKVINAHIPALLSIAGQQKPIELRLNEDEKGNCEIVGFVYPAPNHANGC